MRPNRTLGSARVHPLAERCNLPLAASLAVLCDREATISGQPEQTDWGATAPQLQAILEGLVEGVNAFNMEGNVHFINPVALTMYGFEGRPHVCDNVLALDNLFEIHYPNGEAVPAESYPAARVLRGETFSGYELWVRRRGKEERRLASYSSTQVEDSITLGVLTVRDVTRERELEARFRATFEANPIAISVARLTDLRFTEVNDSFLKLTGYTDEEVFGRTASELRIEVDKEKRQEALERLQQGETDFIVEHEGRLQTKTGDELPVLSEGRVVNYAGDPHLIDTYLDITQRKQNEEQFHQAI